LCSASKIQVWRGNIKPTPQPGKWLFSSLIDAFSPDLEVLLIWQAKTITRQFGECQEKLTRTRNKASLCACIFKEFVSLSVCDDVSCMTNALSCACGERAPCVPGNNFVNVPVTMYD
jgi:hypothetical protein